MLLGFALIAVAAFMCCGLLIKLSIHALPLFAGATAAHWVYRTDAGLVAAALAGIAAAVAIMVIARFLLAAFKSPFAQGAVGLAFAAPAAFAGYHAAHGIAAATMPVSAAQQIVSILAAVAIGVAAWSQFGRGGRPGIAA